MTDRGRLHAEGPTACPFVAFEDDRDRRAAEPDHRHRCYAEPTPAPRAIAHQNSFCLAAAFPSCPIFLDWAGRAAAEAVPTRPQASRYAGGPGGLASPFAEEREVSPSIERSGATAVTGGGAVSASGGPAGAAAFAAQLGAFTAEASPEDRDRGADTERHLFERPGSPPRHSGPRSPPRHSGPSAAVPAVGTGAPPSGTRATGGTRATSGTDRIAVPIQPGIEDRTTGSREPSGHSPAGSAPSFLAKRETGRAMPTEDDLARGGSDEVGEAPAFLAGRAREPGRAIATAGPDALPLPDQARRITPGERRVTAGPAWEPPKRFEAYPTLRTRVGMAGVPRIALAALGLLAAAAILFFLPGLFVGGNRGGTGGGGAGASASASAVVQPSRSPTPIPSPTPQLYAVRSGDTLAKIAKQFGLTVDQVLAANPEIRNPDRIAVGQQLVIPDDDFQAPGGSEDVESTASPDGVASTAPAATESP